MKEKITELLALVRIRQSADMELRHVLDVGSKMGRPRIIFDQVSRALAHAQAASDAIERFMEQNPALVKELVGSEVTRGR